MTNHLTASECVSALDLELSSTRQTHLTGCRSCQAQVDELRALIEAAQTDAEMPEPSPLFWDHFQARVRRGVEADAAAAVTRSWWQRVPSLRMRLVASATVVAVTAGLTWYVNRPVELDRVAAVADTGNESLVAATAALPLDGEAWEFMAGMLDTLDREEVGEVLMPSRHSADFAMEALSSAERDRLMKLLEAELAAGLE